MTLVKIDDEWRISDPPSELILTSSDFPTAYRQRVLYFLDRSGSVVVPDVRHIVIGQTPANRANRLLALLIDGPSARPEERGDSAASPPKSGAAVQPVGGPGRSAAGRPHRRRRLDRRGAPRAGRPDRLDPVADHPRGSRSPSTGCRWTRRNRCTRSTRCPRSTRTGSPGTGQVASDPFYVSPGGAIIGLLDGKPVPGPLGTGSPTVLSRGGSRRRRARSRRWPPIPAAASSCCWPARPGRTAPTRR